MTSKLKVLDVLTKLEDKYEEEMKLQVEEKVTSEIIKQFGDLGKHVAAVYYKKVIEPDVESKLPDCPTCDQKAKLLIKKLKTAQAISESITDPEFEKLYDRLKSYFSIDQLADVLGSVLTSMDIQPDNGKILIRNLIIKSAVEELTDSKQD